MSDEDISPEVSNEDVSREVSTRIDQKLSEASEGSTDPFIVKVDNILRMANEAAYEPKMVSIGPYHRGKKNLQMMENYKLEYFQGILTRQKESSARRYINSLIRNEKEARSYYAEEVSLCPGEFVEMMLLDGCFIVEFLRKYRKRNEDNHIVNIGWIVDIIRRDFLLFENQIPFFILVQLFDMTVIYEDYQEGDLISLAIHCLNGCITVADLKPVPDDVIYQPFHVLNLMYESWLYSSFADRKNSGFSCINLVKLCCNNNTRQQKKEEDPNDTVFIKSVSELKQYGIEFVKSKQSTSWVDIKFENGEIRIPPLVVHDDTESILRNLMAYEQYMSKLGHYRKFFTDYATFMDYLINEPMDIQELRVRGIITSWLGDDKVVTDMFNKLGSASISHSNLEYREIFRKVNKHCKQNSRIWNSWKSDFNNTYFKNPWSIMSLLAAIILLVLTLIQTIFSILPQFKKDPMMVCNCK